MVSPTRAHSRRNGDSTDRPAHARRQWTQYGALERVALGAGFFVFQFRTIVFEGRGIAFDPSVSTFEVGATLVSVLVPELSRAFVSRGRFFVSERGLSVEFRTVVVTRFRQGAQA